MSRSKMPHNNRVSSSAALKTNSMWSKTIGYDPYASTTENQEKSEDHTASLMLLARMSNLSGVESRGNCKRCGMLGHLTFQCRNPVQQDAAAVSSDDDTSSDEELANVHTDAIPAPIQEDLPCKSGKKRSRESDEDEKSESSDNNSNSSDNSSEKKKHKKKHSSKSGKKKSSKHHKKHSHKKKKHHK